ncbi:hypothetical protein SAMN04487948_10980 [Halogranum amylolyticum]|uniref:Small CPxCG-related zinc finger protein n=1 Tax=Halogranum amylolyticum TaxID=660520 RepID=A0A1H8U287_9EURY|nr:hypothetical protein SAMN04487948_10980 [Halogranum amylolyticum]
MTTVQPEGNDPLVRSKLVLPDSLVKFPRHKLAGMAFEWESIFECGNCGVTERSAAVDSDCLGYPVCPRCGRTDGPLAEQT